MSTNGDLSVTWNRAGEQGREVRNFTKAATSAGVKSRLANRKAGTPSRIPLNLATGISAKHSKVSGIDLWLIIIQIHTHLLRGFETLTEEELKDGESDVHENEGIPLLQSLGEVSSQLKVRFPDTALVMSLSRLKKTLVSKLEDPSSIPASHGGRRGTI